MKSFIVIFLICLLDVTYQDQWTYEDENLWPGQCTTGLQQSPINIKSKSAVVDQHGAHIRGPLVFHGYKAVNMTGTNNGHTLKWSVVPDTATPMLSGGPLRGNYSLMQFHFHWLSEHAIDGIKYPLEVHLVHIKTGLTINEALERRDGLAVIGVLFEVRSGKEYDHALNEIMPFVPELVNHDGTVTKPKVIDVTRLFSPIPQSFYTYHGSLTTPMCNEIVTWIVMDKPLILSDTQYKLFSTVDVGGMNNFRSLQPANRIVYRSVSSCASMMAPQFLGFLATLLSCSTSSLVAAFSKGVCVVYNMKRKLFGDYVKECTTLVS